MEADKNRILNYAKEKFLKQGFYKISMDEIALSLKMSKKTIYKYFPSKENLVDEIVTNLEEEIRQSVDKIVKGNDNAITKITNMMVLVGSVLCRVSDKMIADLESRLPHVWEEIDNFRTKQMIRYVSLLVDQGKSEGLIKNIPTEIIFTVYAASIRAVINPEFVLKNKFSMKEALDCAFEIVISGFLTDKGMKIFNKSKSRIDQ